MGTVRITFLGTGTAFNEDGRGSQAILIFPAGGSPFLVDAGPTLMVAMMREELDSSTIDRLFLTHLHGDHVAGWPFLVLHQIILHQRTRPFHVYGPHGTRECLQGLLHSCYADLLERQAFEIRYHELPIEKADAVAGGPGVTLDTLPMNHHPTSIGLRFHLGSDSATARSVAVSGDTAWCENLELLGQDCELLILECTTITPTGARHVSLEEVRRGIVGLGAGEVVLTHLSDEVAGRLSIDPIPGVSAAHDGMVVDI